MAQKKKSIQIFLKIIIGIIIAVSLFVGVQYYSVENVFEEMNYSAVHYNPNWIFLPNISDVLKSSRRYKDTYKIISLPLQTDLPDNEKVVIIVGEKEKLLLEFSKEIKDSVFLYITYGYKKNQLVEKIEISNSDLSLSHALENYSINKVKGISDSRDESLQSFYWFSSSKGIPSLQLTDTKEVLEYLKPYGIDFKWIKKKSDYMLYDLVLKPWFEKRSHRYSLDNLGNVNIVPLKETQSETN